MLASLAAPTTNPRASPSVCDPLVSTLNRCQRTRVAAVRAGDSCRATLAAALGNGVGSERWGNGTGEEVAEFGAAQKPGGWVR
jgi:hypothetical protein